MPSLSDGISHRPAVFALPGAGDHPAIRQLDRDMGIPDKLAGIREEDISGLARRAEKEANPLYPVPRRMEIREPEEIYHQITDGSVEP